MQLKSIIRVELIQTENRDYSNSIHVCYSKSDSVISIKHKLQLVTGIPTDNQILYHATSYLSDSTLIHILSQANHPIPTLHMHVSVKGGAARPSNQFASFIFKDVTREECFENSTCSNPCCISVQNRHKVCIPKGMYQHHGGYVSLRCEVFKLTCPACQSKIPSQNWFNIVFYNCTADIEWRLTDDTEGEITLVTEDGKYTQAKEGNGTKEYHSLDATLK
ncbi:hypothetical protein LOD99_5904 [Oopsacas minuta]|uniref:Ubiquitin-like domain-containing protein n=1 Tax=Oopsacas minuta TaxID=111878 RepID=A0AAV7JP13_9METZ|nr:hypothetical protein LOD99_5904 [Oopsacas minuta]